MHPQKDAIHIKASRGDIASVVIMPGDPLRAKYIAENFLEDYRLVSEVRNMFCYTGLYKGQRVSVMGSGMGMPSMSIYAFELFYYFGVEKIIRIGTSGAADPSIHLSDVIVAKDAFTLSNFAYNYSGLPKNQVLPSLELTQSILDHAKGLHKTVHYGTMLTTEVFGPYTESAQMYQRIPSDVEPICEEMEAFALFYVAENLNKEAAALTTVVDSKYENHSLSSDDREKTLNDMITIALESII